MSLNEPRIARISLIEFKWASIGLIELEKAQMSVSSNVSKWAYKRSKKPK